MIDTDEYEGHTKGPWEFKHINSNWYQCDKIGEIHMEDIAIKEASANARLIADAPLLLAEVKRLRYIVDSIPDEVWKDMKTWEAMKGVIE
jgi:hypothetical protein